MAEECKPTISEMIADSELMTKAIQQGVREELLAHARAGNSVPVSENGKVANVCAQASCVKRTDARNTRKLGRRRTTIFMGFLILRSKCLG